MSLVGNLEDLGLGEILQIVSLSRKSGVLQLNCGDREGRVIFRDGQVIRASSTVFPENIGDLLFRGNIVDIETFKLALAQQQQAGEERRIGDILADEYDVSREAIETVVREQVERIVYSFFGWSEGAFSFELGEPEEVAAITLNPLQFMLDQGLNPQWLAMEGSRIIDEKRHRGEDLDERGESTVDVDSLLAEVGGKSEAGAPELSPEPITGAIEGSSPVERGYLIVDDDPATAEKLTELLNQRKVPVRIFTNGLGFMEAVSDADPRESCLVIDLIMPRKDGSGVLGGLELVEEIRQKYPDFQILVMSDHPNQEAEQSVRNLGVQALLPKPKKNEVLEERGQEALAVLVDALVSLTSLSEREEPQEGALFNIGVELLREMGESASGLTPSTTQQSPGLHLLRGMLQELNNPALGGGIILLILRFASELMNRAVILLVKEEEIVGLGQFGIELEGEPADIRVRNTRIPTKGPNLFTEALQTMSPYKMIPNASAWDTYLFDQMGGGKPAEVFVGPLISEGRVVAVLYGDNLPEQTEIGDTETLEIFLSQAGLAMEKALLERRMSSRNAV